MGHAKELAESYDRTIIAFWGGDPAPLHILQQWLSLFWTDSAPASPGPIAAVSPHAAGGRSIRWSETDLLIYGTVPGKDGCYQIPVDALVPVIGPLRHPVASPAHPFRGAAIEQPGKTTSHCTVQLWDTHCDCAAVHASR